MKKASAVGLVLISMIVVGCERAVPPVSVAPSADGSAAVPGAQSPTPASGQVALDKIDKKLGTTAYLSVDGFNGVASPQPGAVIPVTGKSFQIAGFAVDEAHARAAAGVVILVDGQSFVAVYGGERPDIAKALDNQNYLHSQFWAEIPTAGFAKGLHDVSLRVVAGDRSGYYESKWVGKVSIE